MNEKEIIQLLQEDPQTLEEKVNWTFKATKLLLLLQLEQIKTFKLIKKIVLVILAIIAARFGINISLGV